MVKNFLSLINSTARFIGNLALGLVLLIGVYLLVALLFTFIPANMFSKQPEKGITVYLKSNGVHTDIVVPTENKFYNWSESILPEDFGLISGETTWSSFGWGDKGFYLNTPNWSDLKVTTALDAVMPFFGESAMHVTLYDEEPTESAHTKKIILTEEQYLILCAYISKSFTRSETEKFILLEGYHYAHLHDNFYEAEGSYDLFTTCNTWTNSALKAAGVRTAFWAPFDKCVLYHF